MGAHSDGGAVAPGAVLFGRYRCGQALGSGAGGHVYRALDLRTGAAVALKLRRARDGVRAAFHGAQFEREYHTLRALAHPAIVEVFDHGVDGERAYYTMELLDGADLRDLGGQLDVQVACRVLRDVASALSALHARKLVHRDVSTHNVRHTLDGRAKLIDFGALVPMGVSTVIVGTPPFVPPEALALQALDGRSDLYALGAIAYFLLSGRDAYPASELRELPALWRSPLAALRSHSPHVPVALESLVHQLLSLERGARPASASAVIERLGAIAELPFDRTHTLEHAAPPAPLEPTYVPLAVFHEARRVHDLRRELGALGDPDERGRAALSRLVALGAARGGLLFAPRGGELVLLAATQGEASSRSLCERLAARLDDAQAVLAAQTTRSNDEPEVVTQSDTLLDARGRPLRTLLLPAFRGGRRVLAGVAVLREGRGARPSIELALLEAIAEALLDHATPDPVIRVA